MAVNLINEDQVQLTLRFRVFNDGVGFRYEYNVPNVDSLMITDELTTFHHPFSKSLHPDAFPTIHRYISKDESNQ